jgi:hypothetical protein
LQGNFGEGSIKNFINSNTQLNPNTFAPSQNFLAENFTLPQGEGDNTELRSEVALEEGDCTELPSEVAFEEGDYTEFKKDDYTELYKADSQKENMKYFHEKNSCI